MNFLQYPTSPTKYITSVSFLEAGQLTMASIFSGSPYIPLSKIIVAQMMNSIFIEVTFAQTCIQLMLPEKIQSQPQNVLHVPHSQNK